MNGKPYQIGHIDIGYDDPEVLRRIKEHYRRFLCSLGIFLILLSIFLKFLLSKNYFTRYFILINT